jgi:hypothetical protein
VTDFDDARLAPGFSADAIGRSRVAAEFREMPGLRITAAQAARLFSLDAGECHRVLDALVGQGVLWVERGLFRATGAGRRHA